MLLRDAAWRQRESGLRKNLDLSLRLGELLGRIRYSAPLGGFRDRSPVLRKGFVASVAFSNDEVRKLETSLADVFDEKTDAVRVRNFKFTNPLNSYTKDFTAVADRPPVE